jgi:hypothetical protein
MAAYGLKTGRVINKRFYDRDDDPGMYWFSVVVYIALGFFILYRIKFQL